MVAATTPIDSAEPAFERLFHQEYGRVVSVAFRITRDASAAEDVAQDVFTRFARSAPRDFTRAGGWLYRAAVHTALNSIRARRRRDERERRAFFLRVLPLEQSNQRAADPQAILERNESAIATRSALLRLRRADAQILALRYGGLSYAEIASVVGIDVRQIGTRLARAERALRREIDRETLG